jgi:hypothetical protein
MADSGSGGVVLFEEVQDAPWPLTVVGLGAGAAGGIALTRALSLVARFGAAALLLTGVSVALREYLIPFRIRLQAEELVLEYGKRTRYRIRTRHIVRAYERAYDPLREFGGWGIRKGKMGQAFTFRGRDGVQLELRSGKRVLIGSQQAAGLAAAIRALTGCSAAPKQGLATVREVTVPPAGPEGADDSHDWANT